MSNPNACRVCLGLPCVCPEMTEDVGDVYDLGEMDQESESLVLSLRAALEGVNRG